jgi:Zn-dependent metalloprotease
MSIKRKTTKSRLSSSAKLGLTAIAMAAAVAIKRKITKSRRSSSAKSGFKTFALHVTEQAGRDTFAKLRAERPTFAAFALDSGQPSKLDPESAAKRILQHTLASDAVPSLTAPKVDGTDSDFKSLGVETVPLTGTSIVKFRQYIKGVPVYGSLVSIELDDDNECISLNSNVATPDVKSHVAKISPQDALKKAAFQAGYGNELPDSTPTLNYYLDPDRKWHLAYIVENVPVRKQREKRKAGVDGGYQAPSVFDYVVDALTGSLVAELPRTPSMAASTDTANDDFGGKQTIRIEVTGTKKMLRDTTLNVETYDFGWRDPELERGKLPGILSTSPPAWKSAAVSAHVNAVIVASFMRNVLKRNNIDDKGGRLVSTVNCVLKEEEDPAGSRVWLNAFWDPEIKQMVYGQAQFKGKLRSLAAALDVVAHELFHGVTDHTSKLEYALESGAMNESYSDIFGVIISNASEPDIGKWNWLMGDGISSGLSAFRDFQDPTKFRQPKHMKNFFNTPNDRNHDYGGVHTNSGIHNFAAYNIMTARDAATGYLFKATELAAIFYIALTQQLSRQSTFADSRRSAIIATRSLFRNLRPAELSRRVAAVETGFDAAGIK